MRPENITRRQALTAGVGTAVLGPIAAGAFQREKEKSWLGRIVLPRRYAPIAMWRFKLPKDPDGKPSESPVVLSAASYAVRGEEGTRVEVLNDDLQCWVEKEHFVPLDDSIEYYTKALEGNEKDTFALVSRGWAYYLLGKPDRAIVDFDAFLKMTPSENPGLGPTLRPLRSEGLVNRGLVLAEQGEFQKALSDLDEAIRISSTRTIAYINRSYTYELMGEYEKALTDYRVVGHTLAFNNYAWVRATCPDARFLDAKEAVENAKRACDATGDSEGMYLDTLAAAYAEAGKFDDAVKTQELALTDKSFVFRYGAEARQRLKLYQDKKPFRSELVKKK